MVTIYILQLEKGKYYIGKTNNIDFRLENHFNSNGSEWTKKYKPIKVLEIIKNCDDYDEDKYTRIYMDKYGINNVRGGSFVSLKLKKTEIEILKKMSTSTTNKCFICQKEGHFARDCPENWTTDEDWISDDSSDEILEGFECEYCKQFFTNFIHLKIHENLCINKSTKNNNSFYTQKPNYYKKQNCFRCGREGHYVTTCYASTHIKGYTLK